jgi:hypothetical protein
MSLKSKRTNSCRLLLGAAVCLLWVAGAAVSPVLASTTTETVRDEFTNGSWSDNDGTITDRNLAAGQSTNLTYEFDSQPWSTTLSYNVEAEFAEGCSVNINGDPDDPLDDGYEVVNPHYPTIVGADQLHAEGITGAGVTVATSPPSL